MDKLERRRVELEVMAKVIMDLEIRMEAGEEVDLESLIKYYKEVSVRPSLLFDYEIPF